MESITKTEYCNLAEAFDYYNEKLFEGQLPGTLITLMRKAKARGYHWTKRFRARGEEGPDAPLISEIALNPDHFEGRSTKEILSTLVHEMCHHWQSAFGKESRNGYHNKQWGRKMKAVGLYPSDIGAEGGKETGQRVSHYIIEGGEFDRATDVLLAGGWALHWDSPALLKIKRPKSKLKYSCTCGQNAWAKPKASIKCGKCDLPMESEDADDDDDTGDDN